MLRELSGNREVPSPHKQVALAKRLNCYSSTINRNRTKANFKRWTQQRDPDGWGWVYRYGLYYPVQPEQCADFVHVTTEEAECR